LAVPYSWNSKSPSEPVSRRTLISFFVEDFFLLRRDLSATKTAITVVTPGLSAMVEESFCCSLKFSLIVELCGSGVTLIGSEGV
jgi:hypothetical protein